MKTRLLIFVITFLITAGAAMAQSSWLDRPLNNNWNNGNGVVPNAPRTLVAIDERCRDQIRNPESLSDRAVTRAGWSLFGAAQTFGPVTVIGGMASIDGMCRPTQYNTFVFVSNRFAGMLSPSMMDSRTDGSLVQARLNSPTSIAAEFSRYTSNDPLCCPSQISTVSFNITVGASPLVKADNVQTEEVCRKEGGIETQDNVVSGTVTYHQRSALPPTAIVIVKLVDVSRQDVPSTTIVERRIETAGKQVPIPFDFAYDRSKINERNRYAVQAEIRDGGKLLFITDTSYPVITQGNPRVVDMEVVPVGGVTGMPGGRSGVIRGTVSYLQRIALGANSEVTVRLVDSGDPNGTPAAETKVATNGKQVPIPFELRYEPRDINRQRNYELQAEIRTKGKLKFKTERGQQVTLRSNLPEGVELVLVAAAEEPEAITGKSVSLSKFGTGSLRIGDRATQFLLRASVNVRTDGTADVSVSGTDGTTPFSGKLTYFDDTTLRVMVTNSGDADASGEIEIKYSGRKLNSISATNLMLDGQNVTLRF